MNLEIIDKWLDNEFGVSYTRLEELHDFVIEQDLKHQEKADKEIERLNNIIDELKKYLNEELENYTIEIENKNKGKLGYTLPIKGEIKNILDKLNELKGDNK